MSLGLGPVQRRLLDLLSAAQTGVPVTDLPELLDLEERRSRTVVASLVERDLVEVAHDVDLGGRRAWLPAKRREYLRDGAIFRAMLDRYRNPPGPKCPTCGNHVKQALSVPPGVQEIA